MNFYKLFSTVHDSIYKIVIIFSKSFRSLEFWNSSFFHNEVKVNWVETFKFEFTNFVQNFVKFLLKLTSYEIFDLNYDLSLLSKPEFAWFLRPYFEVFSFSLRVLELLTSFPSF